MTDHTTPRKKKTARATKISLEAPSPETARVILQNFPALESFSKRIIEYGLATYKAACLEILEASEVKPTRVIRNPKKEPKK